MYAIVLPFLFIVASNAFSQEIRLQYDCLDPGFYTRSISASVVIDNTTGSPVQLSDLKVRYYYTKEWDVAQQFTCIYASVGISNVIGTFGDGYVEISFAAGASSIPANGSSGEIRFGINNADWTLYHQVDDYSFNAEMTTPADWDRITVYRAGTLVWGSPQPAPTAAPTETAPPMSTPVPTLNPTAVPTSIPTGVPTVTPIPPTPTPAGPTPVPTSTPVSPTAGPTAAPTSTPAVTAAPTSVPTATPQTGNDDWLHVSGNCIMDMNGRVVRLTGTNWFGFNTGTNTFDGIWSVDLKQSLDQIARRGFNVLRIPISTEIITNWKSGSYPAPNVNLYVNSYLQGKNSLEILDFIVQYLKSIGMKAILDMHGVLSAPDGHLYPLWYKDSYTPEMFYSAWEWIVDRYRADDTLIGVDLKNEPNGLAWNSGIYAKWDTSNDDFNWKKAAETAATRILARNPYLLILVEGIESFPRDGVTWTSTNAADYSVSWWGANLRGVATMPISIGSYQSQVVYAPHEYGPNVFVQPWFYSGFNKDTLYQDDWYPNWYYIVEAQTAPMFIGEWGGKLDGGDNQKWMTAFRDFIVEKNLHHTYWCYNADSGDTEGLVTNDWLTWDETKYEFVKPTLWQNAEGKFVGLDHAMPLYSSSTGTTISEYYSAGNPVPSPPTGGGPVYPLGDVNHSNSVDIVDALIIAQVYVGKEVANYDPSLADVNSDGQVTIVDALLIAQLYIGIIDHF